MVEQPGWSEMTVRRRAVTVGFLVAWIALLLVARHVLADDPNRQWYALAIVGLFALLALSFGGITWIRRQRLLREAPLDRRAQLASRRRTIAITWVACLASLATVAIALLGPTEVDITRACTRSDIEPGRELCVAERGLDLGAGVVAGLTGSLLVSALCGSWALRRWRKTMLEVSHPDPTWDERPWHRRDAWRHRMMIVSAFASTMFAGSALRPSTTSTYDGVSTSCGTVAFGDGVAEVCSSHPIEVERVVQSGSGSRVVLIVYGAMAAAAATAWWMWATTLDRRRRIEQGYSNPAFEVQTHDPSYD